MMHDIRFSDAHNMQSTGTRLHVAMNLIVKLYTYQCISRHSKSIYHAFMMHDIRFSDAHNMQSTGTRLHVAMNLIVKLYTYQCSRHLYTV